MDNITKSFIIIIICISCFIVGILIGSNYKHNNTETIIIYDTVYNKTILDSISYNIKVKDSIIVKLKHKMQYEIEQAINADDSTAIKQFYELAGSE